ncbi:fungal-specific transcription factor domain-containing protein [Phaeosphaeriaceae sp. PMI808]|nr:fungal-specific transcription factor domain-containing protein [Phaeosphaeriaceae sp. PMI808]
MERVNDSKQRFSKSRNGMSVLSCFLYSKNKPTCEQCARRRITCGGYKIDVRWKQAPEPNQTEPKRNRADSSSQAQRPRAAIRASLAARDISNSKDATYSNIESQPQPSLISGSEAMVNLMLSTTDIDSSSMSLPTPQSLGFLFQDFNHNIQPGLASPEPASHSSNASPRGADCNAQINAIDYATEIWNMETFWEGCLRPPLTAPFDLNLSGHGSPAIPEFLKNREDEVERIAYLFHQQTCHTLSIEEVGQNPWKTLVWPLATDHPALYHAIAALTCFGMSKQYSQLRSDGTRHAQQSTQLLSDSMETRGIPLDVMLAATLALGFAETWDGENLSVASEHIRRGGAILQQISSNQDSVLLTSDDIARLDFLGHTWMYMDVLARFTSCELSQPYMGSTLALELDHFGRNASKIDPLMGYSTSFFPIMRCAADLINKVRARETARNSPAIISQALQLRRAIEEWTPPIDLETIDDPSQLMTDAIQTAEAYRWSTLMLLYQAVPELPNLTSYGELAQRILVYLATIPLSSTTIIVHIFPLMVAGCDAVEEEDMEFVRERWNAMAKRIVRGTVERCLKITEELWKRREEYLCARGLAFTANGRQINVASNETAVSSKDIASFINLGASPGANVVGSGGSGGQGSERFTRKGNGFPISAAFKKGVDILTRSGCTEYTVRGRLHWLGVMKDWNCQVMLG